jgi:PAS domain-containing protein
MPRHAPLAPAKIIALNKPFYCTVKISWPEAGIIGNAKYEIQPGPTFPDDIIAIRVNGRPSLCKLIARDHDGNLTLRDRLHNCLELKRGSFAVEGRLILDSCRLLVPNEQIVESALIATDSILSWRNDAQGSNFGISLQWIKLTGQTPREIKDLGWVMAAHPDDRERIVRIREAGIKARKIYSMEYRVHLLVGGYLTIHTYSAPIIGSNGEITGWHGAARILKNNSEGKYEMRMV